MQQAQVETLEKAGGLILDQLVAAHAITPAQQTQILGQQAAIEQETGKKPFVGELLDSNGIDTKSLKQPLLDLQATARALLHSHGEGAAAARAEGPQGAVNLAAGVPDNEWTLKDMQSGDPMREQTALLQTRLVQTKTLATAANMLEANGIEIPASTLASLRASQDAAREGFGASVKAIQATGMQAAALQETFNALPAPAPALNQQQIHNGLAEAMDALHNNGLLTQEQANTVLSQEADRSSNIGTMVARRHAMAEVNPPAHVVGSQTAALHNRNMQQNPAQQRER